MGNTYTALGADDPTAVTFNPAFIGLLSRDHYFSGAFYPKRTSWLPSLAENISYSHYSYHIGFNFKNLNPKIPISVGACYSQTLLDFGEIVLTGESDPEPLGTFESWDRAYIFSIGFCIDYFLRISAGVNVKSIESNLAPVIVGEEVVQGAGEADASDLGCLVQFPVVEMLQRCIKKDIHVIPKIRPFFMPVFSYSMNNIGDGISYSSLTIKDPLPRVARVGIGLEGGFIWQKENIHWRLFGLKWASEAEDDLVVREGGKVSYQKGFGDIDFFRNVLFGKANHSIIKHKGMSINLIDIVSCQIGRYEDRRGAVCYKTRGFSLRISGLLKAMRVFFPEMGKNRIVGFIMERLNFQYHNSLWELNDPLHPIYNTRFHGLSISI